MRPFGREIDRIGNANIGADLFEGAVEVEPIERADRRSGPSLVHRTEPQAPFGVGFAVVDARPRIVRLDRHKARAEPFINGVKLRTSTKDPADVFVGGRTE